MSQSNHNSTAEPSFVIGTDSILGERWVPIYEKDVNFSSSHFEQAMLNIIRSPNINSTVILRADILVENTYDPNKGDTKFVSKLVNEMPDVRETGVESTETHFLHRDLLDIAIREIPPSHGSPALELGNRLEIVRRIIPRNPFKDYIINQTCLVAKSKDEKSTLVVYIPHIHKEEEIPYYLPLVYGVGILHHDSKVSVHYLPFQSSDWVKEKSRIKAMDSSERPIRTALRLLQTSTRHSAGVKSGYEKRVNHDLVVAKVDFQNRYIYLKSKYSSELVNNWCESTDPKKHVFEDLAIAAFLIEYWKIKNFQIGQFEFRDLGCGNGLLVHILISEGYKGQGIDARARKSWATYPNKVQSNLLEKIIVPSILLKPHPSLAKMAPGIKDNGRQFAELPDHNSHHNNHQVNYHSASSLLQSPKVCTTEDFPESTFLIGNHSDELTCWMPLLGFPFIVIPCCSHALNGARVRYPPRKKSSNAPFCSSSSSNSHTPQNSTYGSLVDHVEDIAILNGWRIEKEMLRIPSTRNAAIMSCERVAEFNNESREISQLRVLDIIAMEGGADGWVESSLNLMKKAPRNH
ncbi:uncharacterized protein LODBEIA_P25890 [Lodderomyces beijingensis]|uniref:tRNA (uracil-O(2)-)-methyltransferase n=1 Tax=Lodderomyces beijingensis TaxID=1775926 RepID=A0ABP0ZJP9_9ASCO